MTGLLYLLEYLLMLSKIQAVKRKICHGLSTAQIASHISDMTSNRGTQWEVLSIEVKKWVLHLTEGILQNSLWYADREVLLRKLQQQYSRWVQLTPVCLSWCRTDCWTNHTHWAWKLASHQCKPANSGTKISALVCSVMLEGLLLQMLHSGRFV